MESKHSPARDYAPIREALSWQNCPYVSAHLVGVHCPNCGSAGGPFVNELGQAAKLEALHMRLALVKHMLTTHFAIRNGEAYKDFTPETKNAIADSYVREALRLTTEIVKD